jgi:hypothetical protein
VEIQIRAKIYAVNLAQGEKFAKWAIEAIDAATSGRWSDVDAIVLDDSARRFCRVELRRG